MQLPDSPPLTHDKLPMKCKTDIGRTAFGVLAHLALALPLTFVAQAGEPIEPLLGDVAAKGPFKPTWESLAKYQCPEWFKDAKFGIWAHWTAQCVPEQGDWYAQQMYQASLPQKDGSAKPSPDYNFHVNTYGHPSKVGFKDIDNMWHAERWDPEKLIALYKRAGAQYFVSLANHHDNFDNWDSAYQPWNSAKIGPKRDIVGEWSKAARAAGLRFGVSVHASHAWSWFEPSQGSDSTGPLAGVPYDGKLTKADGKGTWWEGLDPQDLYAQNHTPGKRFIWDWNRDNGSSIPDAAYMRKFYNRTIDLVDKYKPDLLYFDDNILPFHGVTDEVGLHIAAHYYNASMQWHDGCNEAVMTAKKLDENQRKCLVWDIERGVADRVEPFVWQTDTCLGDWHYRRSIYERNSYKSPVLVMQMLADIVSKNGNLLLSVPVRADGTIDDKEIAVVEGIAAWMDINREAIFDTRPFVVCGEGPSLNKETMIKAGNFNEGKQKYSAADIRFTTTPATTINPSTLYAIAMDWPEDGKIAVKTLAKGSPQYPGEIASVELLGAKAPVKWERGQEGLVVTVGTVRPCQGPCVLKITPAISGK